MATKNRNELIQFGKNLQQMRLNAKITQEELAERLVINEKLISRYESGESEMGALKYDKWLSYFGQKVNDEQTIKLLQVFSVLSSQMKEKLIQIASILDDTTNTKD